jgi:hypothetical protein
MLAALLNVERCHNAAAKLLPLSIHLSFSYRQQQLQLSDAV